ncbi:MAG: AMP nucleosidase, partial [Alphaproteobacteria bacterium]|nr:AMP nucleosidase [Alphaproteobacteria bacterium]
MNNPADYMENPQAFTDPAKAVDRLMEIYEDGKKLLQEHFLKFVNGEKELSKVDARYPYLWIDIPRLAKHKKPISKTKLSYGTAPNIGCFGTTLTDPYLFRSYLKEQIALLIENHDGPVYVGISDRQIPVTFALESLTADLHQDQIPMLLEHFHMPDLSKIDDEIPNGTLTLKENQAAPLSLFGAERVDYSLSRLAHYTGTSPPQFQRFVLFTNYQRYV